MLVLTQCLTSINCALADFNDAEGFQVEESVVQNTEISDNISEWETWSEEESLIDAQSDSNQIEQAQQADQVQQAEQALLESQDDVEQTKWQEDEIDGESLSGDDDGN